MLRHLVSSLTMLVVLVPVASAQACTSLSALQGISDVLDKTTFDETHVGGLSALVQDAPGHALAVVDNEGSTPARLYDLRLQPSTSAGIDAAVTGITTLTGYTGTNSDNEGLAVEPDGSLLVSSETEPAIRHFARNGSLLDTLLVPDRFRVAPAGQATSNETLEGLSLSPTGDRLLATMEGPLSADPAGPAGEPRLRLLSYTANGSGGFDAPTQIAYTAEPGQGISDVLLLDDNTALVLERSLTVDADFDVRIFAADLSGATDVSGVDALDGTQAVPKRLLFDLRACPNGLAALDNVEGITLGPPYPDGRQRLYLISDDNFSSHQHTRLYDVAFRLSAPPTSTPAGASPTPATGPSDTATGSNPAPAAITQSGRWTLDLRRRRLTSPTFRNASSARQVVRIRADAHRHRFGPRTLTLAAGRAGSVHFRLSRKLARPLRTAKRLRLAQTLTVAGETTRTTVTLRVKKH